MVALLSYPHDVVIDGEPNWETNNSANAYTDDICPYPRNETFPEVWLYGGGVDHAVDHSRDDHNYADNDHAIRLQK